MSDVMRKVVEYYPHIDAGDLDWVIALFSDEAVYYRADATYRGLPEIGRFFREERRIQGRHTVKNVWLDLPASSVAVTGEFNGRGALGDSRCVRFADVWHFNEPGLVRERQTYLALGHEYVRE